MRNNSEQACGIMASLNEDCVHHINTFLRPHDWVNVSQVCKLWERATLRNWKKITVIEYMGCFSAEEEKAIGMFENAIEISSFVAGKIVLCAAPFIKTLNSEFFGLGEEDWMNKINIGVYPYKVAKFNTKNVLKLMVKKSTELTTVHFDELPEVDLARLLFERNKIVNVTVDELDNGWDRDIPSDAIEYLNIDFDTITKAVSFKGLFPNLKRLRLDIDYNRQKNENSKNIITRTLPYVPRLCSLILWVNLKNNCTDGSDAIFSEVLRLSQLKELTLGMYCFHRELECPEFFLNQLVTCCPKLRALTIYGSIQVNQRFLSKVLPHPRLESLELELTGNVPNIELPKIEHLLKLNVIIKFDHRSFTVFFDFVKKLPCLKKLQIDDQVEEDEERILSLVCGVIEIATSLGKDVFLSYLDSEYYREIFITNSTYYEGAKNVDESSNTLNFRFQYRGKATLPKDVEDYFRYKFYNYNVFVLVEKSSSEVDDFF